MNNLDRFFQYARDRESIRIAREEGKPAPWTDDPILASYRFCNIFREDDKVTEWVRMNVREPLEDDPKVMFAMIVCRWINRIESLQKIEHLLRSPLPRWATMRAHMYERLKDCKPLVTGAYLIKTPNGMNKLDGLLWIFSKIFDDSEHLCARIERGETGLEDVHRTLTGYPFFGPFMAYEVVTDLRHTEFLRDAPDIFTWASLGPGAARGLGRVMTGDVGQWKYTSKAQQQRMLESMLSIIEASRNQEYWPREWRHWEMREVEHTLCEFDKYERARLGEGRPKQLYNAGG